jgi:hypothetical protein
MMGGNLINYPADCGTPTADILTIKRMFNNVISTPNSNFMTINIKDFYLMTPMARLCIPAGIPKIPWNPQEPEFQKKEICSFFAATFRNGRTDCEGMLKNTFLFCRNVKIRPSWDL